MYPDLSSGLRLSRWKTREEIGLRDGSGSSSGDGTFGATAELREGMEQREKVSHPSQIHISHPQSRLLLTFSCPWRDEDRVLAGSLFKCSVSVIFPPQAERYQGLQRAAVAPEESGDETEHYREDIAADVFTVTLLPRCS